MADSQAYSKPQKASPAFQFYPGDFVAGTSRMTTSEVGGYILLLCEQWQQGSIPGDDMKALAVIMRCTPPSAKSVWQTLQGKFARGDDGQWRNARLEQVRLEQAEYREQQAAAGRASAKKRWPKGNRNHNRTVTDPLTEGLTEGVTEGLPDGNSPISDLRSPKIEDELKNNSSSSIALVKPHPIKDFLTLHERLFILRYDHKPAKYTARDAKHAKDFVEAHPDRWTALLEQFFASRDPFIAASGHGLGVLMTVQNKLIAEMSGRAPRNDGRDGLREFVVNG